MKLLFLDILSVIIYRRYLTWKSCIFKHFFLCQYMCIYQVSSSFMTTRLISSFKSFSINELNMHYNENLVYVFPEKELRGLSPNVHIHLSLSKFSCRRISRPIVGIHKSLTDTWMWTLGPFLGIFVLNFRYCVFDVWLTNSYMYWNFAEGRLRVSLYYGFLDNVCSAVEFRDCGCGPQVKCWLLSPIHWTLTKRW